MAARGESAMAIVEPFAKLRLAGPFQNVWRR